MSVVCCSFVVLFFPSVNGTPGLRSNIMLSDVADHVNHPQHSIDFNHIQVLRQTV